MTWRPYRRRERALREASPHDEAEALPAELQTVAARLRTYGASVPRDPAFIARLRVELMLAHRRRPAPRVPRIRRLPDGWMTLPRRQARLWLLSVVAAVMLALGGVAGYVYLSLPTMASAQTILRRAAAALPAPTPGRVIHQVYTVSSPPSLSTSSNDPHVADEWAHRTVDEWTQLGASGAALQQATTITGTGGLLLERIVQRGRVINIYDAQAKSSVTETLSQPLRATWTLNPFGLTAIRRLVVIARHSAARGMRLLPPQTLGGARVYVVEMRAVAPSGVPAARFRPPPIRAIILYIDARSYALRGLDLLMDSAQGRAMRTSMRALREESWPLSAVPAHTFTFTVPATARAREKHKAMTSMTQMGRREQ